MPMPPPKRLFALCVVTLPLVVFASFARPAAGAERPPTRARRARSTGHKRRS